MEKKFSTKRNMAVSNNGNVDFISGLFFAAQFSFFMTAAMGSSKENQKTGLKDNFTENLLEKRA